jgi:hypothetical protein
LSIALLNTQANQAPTERAFASGVNKSLRLKKIMVHLFIHSFGIAPEQGIHPASGWSWKSETRESPIPVTPAEQISFQRRNL